MKTFLLKIVAGAVLALGSQQAMPAGAQTYMSSDTAAAQPAPASQQSQSLGSSLDDRVLLRGSPQSVGSSASPRAAGFLRHTDEHTEVTRRDWLAAGRSEAQFNTLRRQNYGFCVRTTMYILRIERLMRRYESRYGQIDAIGQRYVDLAGSIRTASTARTGGNLLATALGFLVSLPTGGIVGAGAVGNEMQGQAWDESMLVNRDAGLLTTELNRDHVDFNLLALEIYSDYLEMVADYCVEFLGRVPAPVSQASAANDNELRYRANAANDNELRYRGQHGYGRTDIRVLERRRR